MGGVSLVEGRPRARQNLTSTRGGGGEPLERGGTSLEGGRAAQVRRKPARGGLDPCARRKFARGGCGPRAKRRGGARVSALSMERLERLLGYVGSWALHHKIERFIIKADIEKN
jgi:hypothetical protein